jgi:hypothetical protein
MAYYKAEYRVLDEKGLVVPGGFTEAKAIDLEGPAIKVHFTDGFLVIPVQNIVGEMFIELVKE